MNDAPQVIDVIDCKDIPTDFVVMRCRICNSRILTKSAASKSIVSTSEVPESGQKPLFKDGEETCEVWEVNDMFAFDNIGFLKTVDGVKMMTCADCEKEVLGIHVIDAEPKRFMIRADRLKYE